MKKFEMAQKMVEMLPMMRALKQKLSVWKKVDYLSFKLNKNGDLILTFTKDEIFKKGDQIKFKGNTENWCSTNA